MARQRNFEYALPPLPLTFAYRTTLPCRFEQPSQEPIPAAAGTNSEDEQSCPFLAECDSTSGALALLESVYGKRIKVTLTEPSSSIVVRSEHQYNKDERRRMSLRKHFYEVNHDETPPVYLTKGSMVGVEEELTALADKLGVDTAQVNACLRKMFAAEAIKPAKKCDPELAFVDRDDCKQRVADALVRCGLPVVRAIQDVVVRHARATLRCLPLGKEIAFGKYLGFLDIRLNSPRAPLAMGLLVPPRSLRHDRSATIITGEYGHLFGGHGFQCTVYSMQDPAQSGGRCAQACLIMVLAMLADRGALILGSYTLTFLGKIKGHPIIGSKHDPEHLNDPACLAQEAGLAKRFRVDGMTSDEMTRLLNKGRCRTRASLMLLPKRASFDRLARRLIEAYAAARCPLILLVHSDEWYKHLPGRTQPKEEDREKDKGHAVVVVGFKRRMDQAGQGELSDLIVHDPGLAPFWAQPIDLCLDASRQFEPNFTPRKEHIHVIGVTDRKVKRHALACVESLSKSHFPGDWWLWKQLFPVVSLPPHLDYRIQLIHRDDVEPTLLMRLLDDTERKRLRPRLAQLANHWYWAIVGTKRSEFWVLWLYSASDTTGWMDPDNPKLNRDWDLRAWRRDDLVLDMVP